MYGTVNYQGSGAGSGSVGGNPSNTLMLLMQRLASMRGAGGAGPGYGQPDPLDDPVTARAMAAAFGMAGGAGTMATPPMHPRGSMMVPPHPMAAAYQPAPNPQRLPYPVSRPAYMTSAGGIGLGGY